MPRYEVICKVRRVVEIEYRRRSSIGAADKDAAMAMMLRETEAHGLATGRGMPAGLWRTNSKEVVNRIVRVSVVPAKRHV